MRIRTRLRPARPARAALVLLVAAAGCSKSNDVTGTGTTATPFYVRLVQGVSDAPAGLTFAINNAAVLAGFGFGLVVPDPTGSQPYADIQLGSQLGFAATGASTPFYNQAPAGVVAKGQYTMVAYGRVTSGATPAAAVAVLADTATTAAGAALVRVFNALDYVRAAGATGGTPVEVYIYAQGSARPSTPDVAGLAFGARTAYLTRTAAALQVDVFAAGAAGTGAPLFAARAAAGAGAVRTFVLLDPAAGASAAVPGSVLVLTDPTTPR